MSKSTIIDFLREELKGFESTFKETSLDTDNNIHICQDDKAKVYDFDKYVKEKCIEKYLPSSPDAICIEEDTVYFVEFKNSKVARIKTKQIKKKFRSGTNILKKLLADFSLIDVKFIFCVVYKTIPSKYFNPNHIESNITRFGLNDVNIELGNFYKNIITQNVDFYQKEFIQLKCNHSAPK